MALDLGELVARTRVDLTGISQGVAAAQAGLSGASDKLDETGRKGGSRFGSSMLGAIKGSLVGPLAGLLGGAAVTAAFTNLTGLASDYNETLSKSEAIFGAQEAAMEKWASGAARSVGLSKSAALDAAASFGDMFSQIGFTGDAAAKMSQSVVQAAADLGSFSNLDTADVSDRIAAAFRGEYDSLQAVIPNINAARVESEALAATHKKSAKELTAAEKATAVLAIVQKDGARAMGDFAKTSDGAANKSKIMAARLEDQKVKAGQVLLPIRQLALDGFGLLLSVVEQATPVITSIFGFVGDHSTAFTIAAVAVGVLTVATIAHAVAVGVSTGAVQKWVAQTTIAKAATAAWTTVQWALNSSLLANPLTWVVVGLAALVAGLILAWKHSETFRDIVKGAFEAVGKAGTWLWENALRPAFKFIFDMWATVVGALVHGAAKAFGWVPGVGPKLKAAAAEFDKLRDRVDDSLDGIGEEAERYGSDWAMGLARGIAKNQDVPISTARGVANKIAAATRAAHDTHSPSRVAALIGRQWDQGLANGVSRGTAVDKARKQAEKMVEVTSGSLSPVVGSLDSAPASVRRAALGGVSGGSGVVIQLEAPLYLEGREIGRASRRFSLDEQSHNSTSGFAL